MEDLIKKDWYAISPSTRHCYYNSLFTRTQLVHNTWWCIQHGLGKKSSNGNANIRKWQTYRFSKQRHVPHYIQHHISDEKIANNNYDYQGSKRQHIGIKWQWRGGWRSTKQKKLKLKIKKNVVSNYKNPWIICQNLLHGYIEGVQEFFSKSKFRFWIRQNIKILIIHWLSDPFECQLFPIKHWVVENFSPW